MNAVRVEVVLLLFVIAVTFAGETNTLPTVITVDGVIYSNVTWRTVTPSTVSIFHQTGVASLPLEQLPTELQHRFGYDPKTAAAYRAEELAATQQRLADERARQQLRRQREAEAEEAARKEEEAREQTARDEQARVQLAAAQKASAGVELIPVLTVAGAITTLDTGGYAAQVVLSNQTTVCAHFDEGGKRFLADVARRYADWQAQQNSAGQQLQVAAQPGAILLYGGRGAVRIPGGGFGVTYTTGGPPPASGSPPVANIFGLREESSACFSLKGNREAGETDGIKLYVWQ
ncbi:MAG TPA: hypothetical protein VMP11_02400 [Verrucomicrobiae bacterium]|nr:hypothetical protein [Verrucomicrobiae bacterium]